MEIITYRKATNDDLPEIEKIFKSILKEYNLPYIEGESNSDIQDLESQYSQDSIFYVAENTKKKIVGMIGFLKIDTSKGKLTKFYVLKEYRGKQIGKTLLDKIIQFINKNSFRLIILETNSKLKTATYLFQQYGFEKQKKVNLPEACDSFYILELGA